MSQPLSSVEKGNSYFQYLPSAKQAVITVALVAITLFGSHLAMVYLIAPEDFVVLMCAGWVTVIFCKTLYDIYNMNSSATTLSPIEREIGFLPTSDQIKEYSETLTTPEKITEAFAKKDGKHPLIRAEVAARIFELYDFDVLMLRGMLQGIGDDYERIGDIIRAFNKSGKLKEKSVSWIISILDAQNILINVLEKMTWYEYDSFLGLFSMETITKAFSNKLQDKKIDPKYLFLDSKSGSLTQNLRSAIGYYLYRWISENRLSLADSAKTFEKLSELIKFVSDASQSSDLHFRVEVVFALIYNLDNRLRYKGAPLDEVRNWIGTIFNELELHFKIEKNGAFCNAFFQSIKKSEKEDRKIASYLLQTMKFLFSLRLFENTEKYPILLEKLGSEFPQFWEDETRLQIVLDWIINQQTDQSNLFLNAFAGNIKKIGTKEFGRNSSEILNSLYQVLSPQMRNHYFGDLVPRRLTPFDDIIWDESGKGKGLEAIASSP